MLESEGNEELFDSFPSLKNDGTIPRSDLREALNKLGFSLAGYEVRDLESKMLTANETDINQATLYKLLNKVREDKNSKRNLHRKPSKLPDNKDELTASDVSEDTRTFHTVSLSEEKGFSRWMSRSLRQDSDCNPYLPISPSDLYEKCADGILLCKLINKAVPDTIDERIINRGNSLKSVFKKNENLVLAINSAEAIGVCVINIGPDAITKGVKHLVLGLIWQIIRIGLLSLINLNYCAQLAVLLRDGETLDDLRQLSPEELLIRWVNYQLEKAGQSRRIQNFREDIMDSEVYAYLIDQIAPSEERSKLMPVDNVLSTNDKMKRAGNVLENADRLDVCDFIEPDDIAYANAKGTNREKLNLAFVANLFNNYPALESVEEPIDVIEETLEEKTFRNWMNSMGVKPFVKELYADLRNGLVLLQLFDILQPGIVDWSIVTQKFDPKRRIFQMQGNCAHVVDCAKRYQLSVVNLSGEDLRTGERKLTLGLCFQMMRAYTMKMLGLLHCSDGKGSKIDDKEIVNWANTKLGGPKAPGAISSFKDSSIGTVHPILKLIEAIKPGSVDQSLIKNEPECDAKLAISTARKIGARVYALPQHLTDVNSKMVMTVYACLMICDYQIKNEFS